MTMSFARNVASIPAADAKPSPPVRSRRAYASGARSILRSVTDDIHRRMHCHPGFVLLAAGDIGRDDYRRLLARSYGFYAVAEPLLGLSGRATTRLEQDLADLGMTAGAIAALPRCAPLAVGTTMAEQVGGRYVMMGASLGGTVMARAIAGDSRDQRLPAHFLTGDGTRDGDWHRFVATLDARLPDVATRETAARAAVTTFAAFETWMNGWNAQ